MKKISYLIINIIFLLFLYLPLKSSGQLCKDVNSAFITTNPDDPNTVNTWDWRGDKDYTMYIGGRPNPFTVGSPFIDHRSYGMDNVKGIESNDLTKIDYQPTKGWELVYKDFGLPNPNGYETIIPSFAMYNKYTGRFKIFILVFPNPTQANMGNIEINFTDNSRGVINQAYILNPNLKSMDALTGPNKGIDLKSYDFFPSGFGVNKGYWFYAEFINNYDPCVCKFRYTLTFISHYIDQAQIDASITGTSQTIVKADNNTQITNPQNIFGTIQDVLGGVVHGYNDGDDFKTHLQDNYNLKQNDEKKTEAIAKNLVQKFTAGLTESFPYVGLAVGLYNSFFGGGSASGVAPTTFETSYNLKLTGSITNDQPGNPKRIYLPGSLAESNPLVDHQVLYNEALGIFNLLDVPQIKYFDRDMDRDNQGLLSPGNMSLTDGQVNLTSAVNFLDNQNNDIGDVTHSYQYQKIRNLRLINRPHFVVNPASGLELVDIEGALIASPKPDNDQNWQLHNIKAVKNFNFGYGPAYSDFNRDPTNVPYIDFLKKKGIIVYDWPVIKHVYPNDPYPTIPDDITYMTFGTPYLPWSCIDKLSLNCWTIDRHNIPYNIYLRVKVRLRHRDKPDDPEILMVLNYNTNGQIDDNLDNKSQWQYLVSNHYYEGHQIIDDYKFSPAIAHDFIPDNKFYLSGLPNFTADMEAIGGIPDIQDLRGKTVTPTTPNNSILAISKIIMDGTTVINNPSGATINIIAGEEIGLKPDYHVTPDIHFSIGNPINTLYNCPKVYPAGHDELVTFCGSESTIGSYNPAKQNKKDNITTKPSKPAPPTTLFLTLQPNPNNGDFSLSYQLPEDGKVTADVVDMNGRVLCKVLDLANQTAGIYNSSVSCANLAQGVYTLRFVTNQNVIYKRMMVVGH